MRKQIIRALFIVLVFTLVLYFSVFVHEYTHQVISQYMLCTDPEIKMYWYGGEFICHEHYATFTPELALEEAKLHAINEIVGYAVQIIIVCFFVLCLVFNMLKPLEETE